MSARSTTSVFTVGMSRPLSTIVVHTSTSCSRSQNSLHDPLEPAFVHLAVRDRDPRFGNELAHVGGDVLDVLHTVVHVEHLTLAQQLAADRFATPRGRRTRRRR